MNGNVINEHTAEMNPNCAAIRACRPMEPAAIAILAATGIAEISTGTPLLLMYGIPSIKLDKRVIERRVLLARGFTGPERCA